MIYDIAQPFDVLLIEDEPADANLVRLALKESKLYCHLYHVFDGLEALAFLHNEGEENKNVPRPDLILLDMNMPRMNGREFLAAIKTDAQLNAIPVVMLTTSDVERDVITSYKLGASGYITKPVDIDQFIDAIRQLDNYWFTLVRLPKKP
jgi:CheY-like chemotaxis protein